MKNNKIYLLKINKTYTSRLITVNLYKLCFSSYFLFIPRYIKFIYIRKNPNKPWIGISRNPNVTMEFVEKNPNKPWDWYWISRNRFNYDRKRELSSEKFQKAARKIWYDTWIPYYYSPYKRNKGFDKNMLAVQMLLQN